MLTEKGRLFIPGPTPVPPPVVRAMSQSMIGHRSPDFPRLYRGLVEGMKPVFGTEEDVYILSNSGTGAMEMAVANTISPGEPVLSLITGEFGQRFAHIAEAFKADVERVNFPWGQPVDMNVVREKLAGKDYRAVLVTHNETSTGVLNDVAALGQLLADADTLLLVDAVSSLGATDVLMDERGLDMVVTSSQKALMLPPGLSALAVSQKAWGRVKECTSPRAHFALDIHHKLMAKGHTPWTPAISLLYGLEAALEMMEDEGLPEVYQRHERLGRAVRQGARAVGLEPVAPEEVASPTVTALAPPEGVAADEFRGDLRRQWGVSFAGGKGELEGRVLRFAHMGYVDELDVMAGLSALEMGLRARGIDMQPGMAVGAAQEELLKTQPAGGVRG